MKQFWKSFFIALLVTASTVTVVVGMLHYKQFIWDANNSTDKPKKEYKIDENAGDYVAPEEEKMPGIAIPGWPTMEIPANTTVVEVDFFNPIANEGNYYLMYELRLPDNSEQGYEVLYSSDLIEPNKHIQSIELTHGLEPGNYNAIIHVQPVTMDGEYFETNNADMKTVLIVE